AAQADVRAAQADADAAAADLQRFDDLLRANAGSAKQRDDAATRRDVAAARVRGAQDRAQAAGDTLARVRAGARPQEIAVARARVAGVEAQMAAVQKAIADATITAPSAGIVTSKIQHAGELATPRSPIVVLTDLDRAWANVYVDERLVPQLKIGQAVTIVTDAGQRLPGT